MSQANRNAGGAGLVLAAIGIVYGDIGTSPLYTMKEVFSDQHGLAMSAHNVLGAVSLIFWGLMLIVSIKYVCVMLSAHNKGEGGIMALFGLVSQGNKVPYAVTLTLLGAALFYGDGVITPAISVLSAVEGLEVATPAFKPYVVPIAAFLLIGLYAVQARGTAGIGKLFGPVIAIWFAVLGILGLVNIANYPDILWALNPGYALRFFWENGFAGFGALGAVVLAFTGAETLYADMGHFGARSIRLAWFLVAAPALALNYLGQGALLLSTPSAISNPFYNQVPSWGIWPLLILSCAATIIASQATISGTFSMTKQAIALGFLPRMKIIHTSAQQIGQIYIPVVNAIQCMAVLFAVVLFGTSAGLAGAYGIAVTGTMLITSIMLVSVARLIWRLSPLKTALLCSGFLVVDTVMVGANLVKIADGGWFPILIGALCMAVMQTWRQGRKLVFENVTRTVVPLEDFLEGLFTRSVARVPGTAVYLRRENEGVPAAMIQNMAHNRVVHERIVFLTVYTLDVPWVPYSERIHIEHLGRNCYQLNVRYGFKNEPNIPEVLEICSHYNLPFDMEETSFFTARQNVVSPHATGLSAVQHQVFSAMARNRSAAADYYQIPSHRVIELGSNVDLGAN